MICRHAIWESPPSPSPITRWRLPPPMPAEPSRSSRACPCPTAMTTSPPPPPPPTSHNRRCSIALQGRWPIDDEGDRRLRGVGVPRAEEELLAVTRNGEGRSRPELGRRNEHVEECL